jgi:pyrophosphatase PpaX
MRLTYVEFQRGIHDEMVAPFPGAATVLGTLRERGTMLAVVTSKHSGIARRTLECCGLWDAVDYVVCANEVENPKPHPDSVLRALDRFGLSSRPDEVVFVGDSPFDMRAGRSAGTRTAAALWGPFTRERLGEEAPDFFLEDLESVLATGPEGLA